MVQRTHTEKIIWGVALRVVTLAGVLLMSFVTSDLFFSVIKSLGYHFPQGYTIFNLDLMPRPESILAWMFWSSVFFSVIGEKTDYIIISLLFLFSSWAYTQIENATTLFMYLGLIGGLISGAGIAYIIRTIGTKIFKDEKISFVKSTIDFSRVKSTTETLILRVFVLVVLFIINFWIGEPFYQLVVDRLDYHEPGTLFISFYGFSGVILGWLMSYTFWCGVVLGTLGKKIDYVLSTAVFLFAFWVYLTTTNVTPEIYLSLLGVAIVGNLIGYALKVARMHFLHTVG